MRSREGRLQCILEVNTNLIPPLYCHTFAHKNFDYQSKFMYHKIIIVCNYALGTGSGRCIMNGKRAGLAYGIRLISAWMLIPFVLMFILMFAKEFFHKVSTAEVELKEEAYSHYPDEISCFKADVNENELVVYAPVTAKTGDKITVIFKDGLYFKSAIEPDDIRDYVTVSGRFMRICNNIMGYHLLGLAFVLLVSFMFTLKRSKAIRGIYPKLSKITNIAGAVFSLVMSAAMVYDVFDSSLESMVYSIFSMIGGIIYSAVFVLAWITEFIVVNRYRME